MRGYKLSDEVLERINDHSSRIYNIKYGLDFFSYCIIHKVYNNSEKELYCLSHILQEYLNKTKEDFAQLSHELGTDE